MGKQDKMLEKILSGRSDKNIKFKDLQSLLLFLGFTQKENNGDHFIYNYRGINELINIQPDKRDHSKAKSFQVRQVREFIKRNHLVGGE